MMSVADENEKRRMISSETVEEAAFIAHPISEVALVAVDEQPRRSGRERKTVMSVYDEAAAKKKLDDANAKKMTKAMMTATMTASRTISPETFLTDAMSSAEKTAETTTAVTTVVTTAQTDVVLVEEADFIADVSEAALEAESELPHRSIGITFNKKLSKWVSIICLYSLFTDSLHSSHSFIMFVSQCISNCRMFIFIVIKHK